MKYNCEIHHRRSIRLKEYDYSEPGGYFVTVCSYKQENWLGEIIDNEMVLNEMGKIVRSEWLKTPEIRREIELDEFIIMPNHLHGIIQITDVENDSAGGVSVGVQNVEPLRGSNPIRNPEREPQRKRKPNPKNQTNRFQHIIPGSVGSIIRGFKIGVTKMCRQTNHDYFRWQRNFYEHIIRDGGSLSRIREYIRNNPAKWEKDRNNMLENGHKSTTEIDWSEIKQMVAMCPDCLSPRENRLIEMRCGLKDGVPMTLQQIGDIFGFTRERARQIENKALRKLKHPTRAKKLKQYISLSDTEFVDSVQRKESA